MPAYSIDILFHNFFFLSWENGKENGLISYNIVVIDGVAPEKIQ